MSRCFPLFYVSSMLSTIQLIKSISLYIFTLFHYIFRIRQHVLGVCIRFILCHLLVETSMFLALYLADLRNTSLNKYLLDEYESTLIDSFLLRTTPLCLLLMLQESIPFENCENINLIYLFSYYLYFLTIWNLKNETIVRGYLIKFTRQLTVIQLLLFWFAVNFTINAFDTGVLSMNRIIHS